MTQEADLNIQSALRRRQEDASQIRLSAETAWVTIDIARRAEGVWARVLEVQGRQVAAVQNEVDADLAPADSLIEAKAQQVETQTDLIRARYDVIRAQLALLRAVGLASPVSQ